MKYVVVTGGVVSGLGKGVTASSIGVVLKACGLRVTSIKIGKWFCFSHWHRFGFMLISSPASALALLFSVRIGVCSICCCVCISVEGIERSEKCGAFVM
jgi:hypothetical protein